MFGLIAIQYALAFRQLYLALRGSGYITLRFLSDRDDPPTYFLAPTPVAASFVKRIFRKKEPATELVKYLLHFSITTMTTRLGIVDHALVLEFTHDGKFKIVSRFTTLFRRRLPVDISLIRPCGSDYYRVSFHQQDLRDYVIVRDLARVDLQA